MGAILSHVLGHENIINHLIEAKQQGRLPSTFLFVGPAGVGKKLVARGLLQALVCEKPTVEGFACSFCGPCLRAAKEQTESVLMIQPEKNQIKIEQSRAILDFLSLQTLGKARGVIIDHAEQLNPQSANALLKVLEEPPQNTYFFLLAPSSRHVLPTLRSRAQVVSFAALEIDSLKKRSSAPDWALSAAQGSFERLAQLQNKGELESREQAASLLEMWLTNPQAYLTPEWREIIRDRSLSVSLSKNLVGFLRDALLLNLNSVQNSKQYMDSQKLNILNPDKLPLLKKLAAVESDRLFHFAELTTKLEGALLSNRDTQLVFEELWLLS
jgi:DNA polymerase-3 subunit delta'